MININMSDLIAVYVMVTSSGFQLLLQRKQKQNNRKHYVIVVNANAGHVLTS